MQTIITTFEESNSNIKFTVALPIYNSKKIAWISLESLIRQENINFDWELIVYEEIHSESVCPEILEEYKDRLIDKNCKRIIYITKEGRPSLLDKWIEIASHASKTSDAYLLHAADCYSPKNRLKKSYEVIVEKDYDWYDQRKGYFYSFISDKIILYDFDGLTNLNLCTKTKYIKTLPNSNLKRGIDGYIYNHLKKNTKDNVKHFKDNNLYLDSVDTHGLNNISTSRENFFHTKPHIFTITNLTLLDLDIDEILIKKLLKLKFTNNTEEKIITVNPIDNIDKKPTIVTPTEISLKFNKTSSPKKPKKHVDKTDKNLNSNNLKDMFKKTKNVINHSKNNPIVGRISK
jgi:hypothetical protein